MPYRPQGPEMDILICDTAGRLHTKKNLMNELEKINRIIERNLPKRKRGPAGAGRYNRPKCSFPGKTI